MHAIAPLPSLRQSLLQVEMAYLNRFDEWVRAALTLVVQRPSVDGANATVVRVCGMWGGHAVQLLNPGRSLDNDNGFDVSQGTPSQAGVSMRLADGSEINLFSRAGRVHVSSLDFQWMSDGGAVRIQGQPISTPPEALRRLLNPSGVDRRQSAATTWPASMERRVAGRMDWLGA